MPKTSRLGQCYLTQTAYKSLLNFHAIALTLSSHHTVTSKVSPPADTPKWLPWVHIAIANLKRFLLGTFHGVSGHRLQEYLDEFCYRFNRRWYELEIPNRLLAQLLNHPPLTRTSLSL